MFLAGDADYFELIFRDREICEPSAFILEVEKSPLSSHLSFPTDLEMRITSNLYFGIEKSVSLLLLY